MANFDPNEYFQRRAGNVIADKQVSLQQTAVNKYAELDASVAAAKARFTQNSNSWIGKLGLDSDSFVGEAVNLAASAVSGVSRLAGQVVELPVDVMTATTEMQIGEDAIQAYNRQLRGEASQQDVSLLNNKKLGDIFTPLQLIQQAKDSRSLSRGVANTFDLKNIVNQDKRDALVTDLGNEFDSSWGKTKQGWDKLQQSGNRLSGAADIATGLGSLVVNAGEAAVSNPAASAEYIVENLPQLAVGAYGKAGKAILAASNAGYGSELYQQGIENYQKANGGQLPPEELRKEMAMNAAGASLMEQASDTVMLGASKLGKGTTEAVTRTGFKESLKNIGKATGSGLISEAPTEGVQTYLEGEATLKPASAKDIYVGASIGGIAGGGLTGGGRAIAELVGATPDKQAKKAEQATKDESFKANAATGNTDPYLNKENKDYDPVKAAQVSLLHSMAPDTTPEAKQQHVDKINTLIKDLEYQREAAASQLDQNTSAGIQKRITALETGLENAPPELAELKKEQIAALKEDLANFDPAKQDTKLTKKMEAHLSGLTRELAEAIKVRDELLVKTKPTEAVVMSAVDKADLEPDVTTEETKATSKASADHVISLAMAHPGMFSDESLTRLADNAKNSLSEGQRAYLRTVSAYRIAENAAKSESQVQKEVFEGDPELHQLGIKDYVGRMAMAVSSSDEVKAKTALHMLTKFAEGHAQKLALVSDLYSKVKTEGSKWIIPTKQGWEIASNQALGDKLRTELGGLEISVKSPKLVKAVQLEAAALNTAKDQLQTAYDLKFNPSALESTKLPPVASPTTVSTQSTVAPNQSTKVDSTVNSVAGSTVATAPKEQATAPAATPVKSDPTEDYVGTDKDGNQTDLAQGGKPYSSFTAVRKAKRLNPTLRVIKHEGGYVLAPKTEKQIAAQAKAAERLTKPMTAKPGYPMALHEFVAALGGLRRDKDSGEMNEEKNIRIGNRWLFAAKGKGRTVDDIRSSLEGLDSNNYLDYGLTEAQVLQAIKDSLAGDGLYRPNDMDLVAELRNQHDDALNELSATELDQYYALLAKAEAAFNAEGKYADALNNITNDPTASINEMINSIGDLITQFEGDINNEADANKVTQSTTSEKETTEVSGNPDSVETTTEEDGNTRGEGRLSTLKEIIDTAGKKFGAVYKQINLAAYNLKQKLGKDNKTQRPLIAVDQFLTNWPDDAELAKFVGVGELNETQKEALQHFKETADSWLPKITTNLVKGKVLAGVAIKSVIKQANAAAKAGEITQAEANKRVAVAKNKTNQPTQAELEEYRFQDPIQYFLLTSEAADVEENLKTAIAVAAYSYVAENAKTPQIKDREAVKGIFGLSEYDVIGDALVKVVSQLGTPSKVAINSMGQRVSQALGLSPTEIATQDFLPRLESDFGAHVLKLLVDTQVIEQNAVEAKVITEGLKTYHKTNPSTVEQGHMNFIRMVRSPAEKVQDRKLNILAETISDKAKNTSGVLGKLFGVEAQTSEPSWEEIPFTQKTTDNTDQGIPPALAKSIAHENATPFKVNVKVWDLMQVMDKEDFLKLAGLIDVDSGNLHWTNKLAAEAKNDALRREYEVAMDYISRLEMGEQNGGSPLKLDQPIFLNHSVWKQQRVGIEGPLNPQASKLHRWLLTRDAWSTEVSVDAKGNSEFLDSFKLRVMEGLGVKTDKQSNEKSLGGFEEIFNINSTDEKTRNKATLLQAAIDGVNTGDTQAIIAGVAEGGEKMHSLDVIMAMAAYQRAKEDGAYSFKVNMMGEVDGVTNGPMLSHLALGASSPAGMMARLNKGGFFQLDNKYQNYNVWRGEPNRQDLYEATIAVAIRRVQESSSTENFAALQKITGQLHEEGKGVLKAGRNIIKTPLTAMLFGSTVSGAIDSMFGGFMEKAYEGFETIAKMNDETKQAVALKDYIDNLNGLLKQSGAPLIPMKKQGEFDYYLSEFEFSRVQESALEVVFKDTLGVAVEATMKSEFGDFLAVRDTINDTANAAFGLYDAAYQGIRQDVIAELVKSGDIAANAVGNEFHDLTEKQEALIDKRIKALNPTVHTYMSKQGSTSAKSGLHISKSARKLSQEGMYQSEVHFGTGFPDTGALSTNVSAYQRILTTPGVGMLPMMIHSLDSAISHLALMGRSVLNVHDAHGTGLNEFTKTAQALNAATWKVLLGYSPATEMRDSFTNTLLGMDALLASGNTDSIIPELQNYLKVLQNKQATWVDKEKVLPPINSVLTKVVQDMYGTAYSADRVKYLTMSKLKYIDQYALEGGQYEVQDNDRAEASRLLKELGTVGAVIPAEVFAAIDRINAIALGKKPEPKTSTNKKEVATTLKERGEVPAKEILRDLYDQLKNEKSSELRNFRITLLAQLGKLVSDDLKVVWGLREGQEESTNYAQYVFGGDIHINQNIPVEHIIEALLHESVHAVTNQVIEDGRGIDWLKEDLTPNDINAELEVLLDKVRLYMRANNINGVEVFDGDNGIHELVAWGMANEGFRKTVLEKIQMVSKNKKNVFVTAFQSFIETVTEAIFGKSSGRKKVILENGMDVLITNFSGLLGQATENKGKAQPSQNGQSLAMAAINEIHDLTTESIYNALDEGKVTPTFDTHLRGLLTSIVDKLHGPYGIFKSQIERNLVRTPKGLWDQAKRDKTVPFASASLAANIQMDDQVAFVLEQVEVTVASALADNKGEAHAISVEMDKLYLEAQKKLTAVNSPLSQELQDFLFKMDGGLGGKSDHLARFAALGLAHPEVNAALNFGTSRVEAKANTSFGGRLETLFHKILEWFNNKMLHTHAGQNADEKLAELVNQLVNIEAKRKAPMLQKASTLAFVEDLMTKGTDKVKKSAESFGRSDWVQNRKSGFVKAAGSTLSTIAGDRTEQVMEAIQQIRDKQINQGHGLAMGIINEVRGSHDGNKMFYALLREAKIREGYREDLIVHTSNVALEGFTNQGKDLSQADKVAITSTFMRTDLSALLGPFTMDQLQAIVSSPTTRNRTIRSLEVQMAAMTNRGFYEREAKILGYKLATGNVKGKHLLMNAENIANLAGTNTKVDAQEAAMAAPIIDQLASLYALRYTNAGQITAAAKIMADEAKRGNESGIELVLRLHKSLQQQSKEQLFNGSEALMTKGYLPEIYDPKKEVLVATEKDGAELIKQGFTKGKKTVAYDPTDPSRNVERRLYTRDGGGLRPWLSGATSFTGEVAKGSRSRSDNVKDLADWKVNKRELESMYKAKQASMKTEFVYDPDFDPSKVPDHFAAPILNAEGDITDYRYLMREEVKDDKDVLNRDNRFDKLFGVFAGSIYDKTSTKEHNRKVIQTLHDQYNADFATKSVSYRKLGLKSTDPELRDIYRMLPEDTKQAIKEIWGTDYILVRSDLMDITFGYRKQSISDAFTKEQKNVVEQLFVSLATHAMGDKAAYNIRRAEDVWQEIVGEVKDILVIKNVKTLLGNIGSNVSLLYWHGVPFKDMVKYHRIALKGVTTYRADSAALIELETKLTAGIITTSEAAMKKEIARLKTALDANPVKELIDAGLMPSIVEDVSLDDDVYSYKSRLTDYVDAHTNKWNKHIIKAARAGYMSKDTDTYKVLRHATQLSDFVARYTLYQHVTNKKDNPMSKADAVNLASDSFINYDIPSHRNLQYMNDMGFVMFTKYYLRIQKVIAHLYADKPGRAMAMLMFDQYVMNSPILTDSGFLHKMGNNPFGLGALNYPGTLDELATMQALTYPFK